MSQKLKVGAQIMNLHNDDLQSKILEHRLDAKEAPYNLVKYRGEGGPSAGPKKVVDVNQISRKLRECETKVSKLETMLDKTLSIVEKNKTGAKTIKKKKKKKKKTKNKKHKKH